MSKWFFKFWQRHGDRIIFMTAALVMATAFYFTVDLKETGKTILIGVAMLMYNKVRSSEKEPEEVKESEKPIVD